MAERGRLYSRSRQLQKQGSIHRLNLVWRLGSIVASPERPLATFGTKARPPHDDSAHGHMTEVFAMRGGVLHSSKQTAFMIL